jgi:hypothetical protein
MATKKVVKGKLSSSKKVAPKSPKAKAKVKVKKYAVGGKMSTKDPDPLSEYIKKAKTAGKVGVGAILTGMGAMAGNMIKNAVKRRQDKLKEEGKMTLAEKRRLKKSGKKFAKGYKHSSTGSFAMGGRKGKVLGEGRAERLNKRSERIMNKAVTNWNQAQVIKADPMGYMKGAPMSAKSKYQTAVEEANMYLENAAAKEARAKKVKAKAGKVEARVQTRKAKLY